MKPENAAAIQKLLDEVTWEVIPTPTDLEPGELYATHSGMLKLMDVELRVHQLNDGQRIIDADDLAKLFGV